MHIMIDCETLGTAPGASIASIGAVPFGPAGVYVELGLHLRVDLKSCATIGLTIDPDTVLWWLRQGAEARASTFGVEGLHISRALNTLREWYELQKGAQVWCHGATFDVPLLDAAYRAAHLQAPWHFASARCTRTLYELADVYPDRSKGVHHDALNDAINQAEAAVIALRKLGIWAIPKGDRKC